MSIKPAPSEETIKRAVVISMPFVGFLCSRQGITRAQFEECYDALPLNIKLVSNAILDQFLGDAHDKSADMFDKKNQLDLAYMSYYRELKFSNITNDIFSRILITSEKNRLGYAQPFDAMCKIYCDVLKVPLTTLRSFPEPEKKVSRGLFLVHPFVKKALGSVASSISLVVANLCSSVGPLVLKQVAPDALYFLFPLLLLLASYFVFTRGHIGRAFVLTFMPLVIEYASEAFYLQLPKLVVVGVSLLLNCVGHWLVEQDKRALLKVLSLMAGVFPELLLVNGQLDRVHFVDEVVKKEISPLTLKRARYANGNVLLLGAFKGKSCLASYDNQGYGTDISGHVRDNVYLACEESDFMRLHNQLCKVSKHLAVEVDDGTQKTAIKTSRVTHMLGEIKYVFESFGMGAYYKEIEDSLSVFLRA